MKRRFAVALAAAVLLVGTGAKAQQGNEAPGTAGFEFTDAIRVPVVLQNPPGAETALSFSLEYSKYLGTRVHDVEHPNLYSEEVKGPVSMLSIGVGFGPRSEVETVKRGYHVVMEGLKTVGNGYAIGASARYSRSDLSDVIHVSDIEAGPKLGVWADADRLFLSEVVAFRNVSFPVMEGDSSLRRSADAYIQLRHHVAYVPSEDFKFTYAQDVAVRLGVLGTPHTNNIRIDNAFIYSPLAALSFGPTVGVNLDYRIGPATSVLTVPVGARVEGFLANFALVTEVSYDVATITGQRTRGLLLAATLDYRF